MFSEIRQKIQKIDLNFFFIYSVGVLGYALRPLRPVMSLLTPIVLFLTAFYALIKTFEFCDLEKKRKLFIWSLVVFLVTIFLEIMGVKYGLFFGEYDYGPVLGPQVFGVPLIIGINWLIVIMGSMLLLKKSISNIFLLAVSAGTIAFLFDLLMEPAAIALGFWEWSGAIPIKNYLSWFSITFLSTAAALYLKLDIPGKWLTRLLLAQFVFFVFIRIFILVGLFR